MQGNKNVADKVEAWVSKHYDPMPNVNSEAKNALKEPQEGQEDEKDVKVNYFLDLKLLATGVASLI